MKKQKLLQKFLFLLIAVTMSNIAYGQLTGTKTIPGSYATIAAAITDLNTVGVGAGGVIFNVAAGYTESITAPLLLTATGTSANTIVFQKSGSGANPIVTRTDAGSLSTSTLGGQGDAVIIIEGSDYVTFDAINVAASDQGIEYGYYLRKTSVTDGCKFITIKNAAITMTKGTSGYVCGIYSSNNDAASLVSSATGITVTSTGGRNENVTITGNTISNTATGILLRGYNHTSSPYDFYDQNFVIGASGAGNIIQNYAGGNTGTSYAVYIIYHTSPSISSNIIDNAAGGGSNATGTLYGIMISTSSAGGTTVVLNNNITLNQGSTSAAQAIYASSTCTSLVISDNIFNYGTFNSTTTSYFIYCSNSTANMTITGNHNGIITKAGVGTLYGFYDYGSPGVGNGVVSNNNFSNITLTGASTFYGIDFRTSTSQTQVITGNTFSNITTGTSPFYGIYQGYGASNSVIAGNTITDISGAGTMYGLYSGASTAPISISITSNIIKNITTTGASTLYGLYSNLGTLKNINNNSIYNLTANNASGYVYGLSIAAGTTSYVYNNFISDLKAPITSSTDAIRGINVSSSTTSSNIGLYYNTIYLNATSSGTDFGTSCVYHAAASTPTTSSLEMLNNIFVNNSTDNNAGYTVAYRLSGANFANYALTSNNNCFYAGTPSTTNLIFWDGTNSLQTIAAYRIAVSPRDGSSFSENPPFINTTTAPYNLHLQTSVATSCESGGSRIISPIGITTDFDNDTRWGETGYTGTGTSVDVGADEGNFTWLDAMPPSISYTPLPNRAILTARTLIATITDPSGVSSGANQPVLYWKVNSVATYTGPIAPTSVAGNQYTYDFGGGVVGDTIKYFIVAQDNTVGNNVGSFPAGATVTNNPPLASVGPPSPSYYVILSTICGTKTVGTGGDYPTLTAAITDLNNKEISCPVVFSLTDATYPTETFPIIINANYGSSITNTVTIKPATGIAPTITGAANNGPLFKVLGCSHVIIDGSNTVNGTTRDLTFSNTSTTSPQVFVIGSVGTTPITNVTAKNCNFINGSQSSSAVIISDGSSVGTAGYFNNITIQNNTIQKAYIGLYSIAVIAAGNGSGLNITGNDLTATGTNAIRLVGLYVQGIDGATITNNTIGNFDGTVAETDRGIWFATGSSNCTVSGNIIDSLIYSSTGAGGSHGISITTGTNSTSMVVSNNTITALQTGGTGMPSGIYLSSLTSGVTIQKNNISNIKNSNIGGYGCNGIYLASTATTSNIIVSNNMISDVVAYGYNGSGAADNGYGIIATTGTGYGIYYNTVLLNSNPTLTTGLPAAINIASGLAGLDIRNNLFINTQTIGTERYAIYSGAANTAYTLIDNNDYFTSGPNIGYLGANQANITAWRTATGKDVNSFTSQPYFTSDTDLHLVLNSNCGIEGKGTPIAGITTDYDNDTRNATTPDPGADEFSSIANNAPVAPNQIGCFGGTIPDLTAIVVGTAKWYSDALLTNLVYTGTPFATGQTAIGVYTYYVVDSIAGTCISPATTVTLDIITVPDQPSTIVGNTTVPQGSSQNYSVTNVPGVTYTWTFPFGWVQTGGGNTNAITVTVGTGNGDITCTPSNTCGNGTPRTLAVTVTNRIQEYGNNNKVIIQPNPTEGKVILNLIGFTGDIIISIKNTQGRLLSIEKINATSDNFNNNIDLSGFANGMYYIQIENNGKTIVRKVVKQ